MADSAAFTGLAKGFIQAGVKGDVNVGGSLYITEKAAADADVAGKGQIWVKSDTPNTLWFTDDTGIDKQIACNVSSGDPAAYHFTVGNFTTDGNWHDLDLSGTVPVNATWVYLYVALTDDLVGSNITFRKNGNSDNYNKHTFRTQVANITNDQSFWVECDSNRVIEYATTNTVFAGISVTVCGWYI